MNERPSGRSHPERRVHIVQRTPLVYQDGPSAALDRPAHVRAASGVCWLHGKLAIIQDDAAFLALVDPAGLSVRSVALPMLHGMRQFDKSRGNKRHKRDLEACFGVEVDGVPHVFALGSGSSPEREFVIRVRLLPSGYFVDQLEARSLYATLRNNLSFAGSELNVEGAALRGDALVLLQRGNGAKTRDLLPKDASGVLSFAHFLAYLDDTTQPAPTLTEIIEHDLGAIDGVRLTFTDATATTDGTLLFVASAEASPNAVDDGAVVGSVLGIMRRDGTCEVAPLLDEHGEPCRDKVEGVVLDPLDPTHAFLVVDPDDHEKPGLLLKTELAGAWF